MVKFTKTENKSFKLGNMELFALMPSENQCKNTHPSLQLYVQS